MIDLSKPTQAATVLGHLQTIGSITALDAINIYGCMRLAARIHELIADGHKIISEPFTTKGGATIAKYSLANPDQFELFP